MGQQSVHVQALSKSTPHALSPAERSSRRPPVQTKMRSTPSKTPTKFPSSPKTKPCGKVQWNSRYLSGTRSEVQQLPQVEQLRQCLFGGECTFQVDPDVRQVVNPLRKVPVALRDKLKIESAHIITKNSQDIFQQKIDECFEGMSGVAAIVDDILVYGRTPQEHNDNLIKVAPNIANITSQLRQLLLKDTEFIWDTTQAQVFQKVKDLITRTPGPLLTYFDPGKPVVLETDASQFGLVATFLQDGKPVAFASKSLTPAEIKHAQIEKEMLSILFGCKKFLKYLYGREVQLPAGMDLHVHTVMSSTRMSDRRLEENKSATPADPQMKMLQNIIHDGWPEKRKKCPSEALEYWNHGDEMTEIDGIIFKGHKIIIPRDLRRQVMEAVHIGHMGF
ncbi:uncharacterized protein LOC134231536 [Saccostrea cucullata]|uniref:uncharacterized protein LOC134231536 n=1 Tax=Saccostrea cuccullata TaxID=36930 RepID=UPI002ED4978A